MTTGGRLKRIGFITSDDINAAWNLAALCKYTGDREKTMSKGSSIIDKSKRLYSIRGRITAAIMEKSEASPSGMLKAVCLRWRLQKERTLSALSLRERQITVKKEISRRNR